MAEYQKFMFDNFVIECDEEKCIAEPVSVPEDDVIINLEEDIVEENNNDFEDQNISTENELISNDVKEEIPVVPSFSQEDIDAAVLAAEERGYIRGKDEAISENEQKKQEILLKIEESLKNLLAGQEENFNIAEKSAGDMAITAIEKILPTLERGIAKKEVEVFLKDNFEKFKIETNLSFEFHPDMVAEIAPVLSKLAAKHDFEGKIAVHKDVDLGVSDCRVEWKNGGAERKVSAIIDKVKNIIEQ
ncbi:MAG: hypothetical protein E7012_06015 [Alphaproteobacteria bacterium]|nr:hypothetical protein [Alphaproteobacteria bacterium]